jgi:hypothetical protein
VVPRGVRHERWGGAGGGGGGGESRGGGGGGEEEEGISKERLDVLF